MAWLRYSETGMQQYTARTMSNSKHMAAKRHSAGKADCMLLCCQIST